MNLTGWLTTIAASVVVSLVAAFVARLMTKERGPYALFSRWRNLTLRLLDLGRFGREVHELFACPYCLSVWFCIAGAFITLTPLVALVAPMLAWVWLEASGTPALPDDTE
jgi:hypothetical protein